MAVLIMTILTLVGGVIFGVVLYAWRTYRDNKHAAIVGDYVDIIMADGIGLTELEFRQKYQENPELMESFFTARMLYHSFGQAQKTSGD